MAPPTITTADVDEALKKASPIRRDRRPKPAGDAGLAVPSNPSNAAFAPPGGKAELVNLADVPRSSVEWLWPGRFPLGKLCVLAGDPGLGKSFVTMDLAARVSCGLPLPDAPDTTIQAGGVVLLSAEDDLGDTIAPRLHACGADLSRIKALTGWKYDDSEQSVGVTLASLRALEEAILKTPGCRLVIIDPVTAFLGAINAHRADEMRALLAPVAELAAKHRVTILMVTHLNKGVGGNSTHRVTGSLALVAAARASWLVVPDRSDPDKRLMLMSKLNLGRPAQGLSFRISGDPARVEWSADPVTMTADDAMRLELGGSGDDGDGRLGEATSWLRSELADGAVAAKDLQDRAERDGIKQRTLERAKKALGIKPGRAGFAGNGKWSWQLPEHDPGP